jgi:hypothetical protein
VTVHRLLRQYTDFETKVCVSVGQLAVVAATAKQRERCLYLCQKRPTTVSKETYCQTEREACLYSDKLIGVPIIWMNS